MVNASKSIRSSAPGRKRMISFFRPGYSGMLAVFLFVGICRAFPADTLFFDSFTGSDHSNLTGHTPDVDTQAAGWSVNPGSDTHKIVSNRGTGEGTVQETNHYYVDFGLSDFELIFEARTILTFRSMFVIFRREDNLNYHHLHLLQQNGWASYEIKAAGSDTTIFSNQSWSFGTSLKKWRIRCKDDSVKFYRDDSGTWTLLNEFLLPSKYSDGTYVGFNGGGNFGEIENMLGLSIATSESAGGPVILRSNFQHNREFQAGSIRNPHNRGTIR